MQPDVGTSSSASVLEPSIFRVHKKLREVNEKAYEPDIVSIGPYHRDNPSLQMMEVQKKLYWQLFLEQRDGKDVPTIEKKRHGKDVPTIKTKSEGEDVESDPDALKPLVDRYLNALKPLEEEVRNHYAEYIGMKSKEFVEMMLLDGFFIIEVILRSGGTTLMANNNDPRTHPENDPIFKKQWMVNSLQRDLMLFENQLPLCVLFKILDTIAIPAITTREQFIRRALMFFRDLSPAPILLARHCNDSRPEKLRNLSEASHLLELLHKTFSSPFPVQNRHNSGAVQEGASRGFIPSTTELQEAGVKLKAWGFPLFCIKFEEGVMQVPPLTIEDRTDTFFRNLIAYEQYCPSNEPSPFTDYVRFLDCLIDTPKDVQILSRHGIIKNWLGDDEVVSMMFNKINEAVVAPRNNFQYDDIFTRVNDHCGKRRNRWMATLKRDYFNNPWAWISVLAAAVLLLLTIIQTAFTMFPCK